jgi:hypothetical protein
MSSFPLQIHNLTRNTALVESGRVADNFWTRFVSLMGAAGLGAGEGLLITRCNSIHFFRTAGSSS